MKRTKSIICFTFLLATGSASLAGFLSQPAKDVNASQVNEETKTVYLDVDEPLGDDKRWDADGAKLDIWSWENVSTTRGTTYGTVFFKNTSNWDNVYIHFWGGTDTQPSTWPGKTMTKVDDTDNVYFLDIGDSTKVKIHNNNGSDTGDMVIPTEDEGGMTALPNGAWDTSFDRSGKNTLFTAVSGVNNLYSAEIPINDNKGNFIRASSEWTYVETTYPDKIWNKVEQQPISDSLNCLNIIDWDEGSMRKYNPVEDGYYILGTMNEWTPNSDYFMSKEELTYSLSLPLNMYDEFKGGYVDRGSVTKWYGYNELTGSAKENNQLIKADTGSNIVCVNPGTFTPKITVSMETTFTCESIDPVVVPEIRVGDSKYFLQPNPSNPNEYMTAEPAIAICGDTVAYYMNGVLQSATPKKVGNNNCWNDNGTTRIVLSTYATIYVDISDPSALTIFCSGLPTQGEGKNVYGLSIDDTYRPMKDNGDQGGYDEWFIQGVTFSKDTKIKFVNTKLELNNAEVFSVTAFDDAVPTELKNKFSVSEGYLVYNADDSIDLDIYAKFKSGDNKLYITKTNTDLKLAIDYALNFNTQFGLICDPQGITTEMEALVAEWTEEANAYAAESMTDAAREILKEATTSHTSLYVAEFAERYDFIYGKYGASQSLANFANRAVSPKPQVISSNQNTALVAVLVTIGVVSTVVCAVVLKKKNKEE